MRNGFEIVVNFIICTTAKKTNNNNDTEVITTEEEIVIIGVPANTAKTPTPAAAKTK